MWDWVGGRTSITSAVGLLPAALAGIDTEAFLRGAREMDAWTRQEGWRTNPAALLAGGWYLVGDGRGDRQMVVLPYSDRLVLLSRYLQQVVMESIGKRLDLSGREVHQGLVVYGNKGSTDQHAYVQQLRDGRSDFFAQFVEVLTDGVGSQAEVAPGATAGDFLQGFLLGTRRALSEEGRLSMVLTVPEVSASELGAVVALFERAVGLYAEIIGVNAYHQPGVEAGKRAAAAMLGLAGRIRALVDAEPRTAAAIARELDADPSDVFHLLERQAALGRIERVGAGADATYRRSAR
jgi:glucose-6-phosphate isomerase